MNIFIVFGLTTWITTFLLTLFITKFGNLKNKLHVTLILLNVSIAIWGFGCMMVGASYDIGIATLWWKIAHIGGLYIPVFLLHNILLLTRVKKKGFLIFGYIEATIFLMLTMVNLMESRLIYVFNAYYKLSSFGITYPLGCIAWCSVGLYANLILFNSFRHSVNHKRTQLKYLFIAIVIGFWGGGTHFLSVFNVNIFPYAMFLIPVFPAVTTYAILRHQLLDIEVIIRRAVVFAGLFASVYLVFAFFALLSQLFFEKFITTNRWVAMIPSVVVVTFMLHPLENFLVRITDRFLFQKKYDYRELLKTFSGEVLTVLDLSKLVNLTVDSLSKIIRLESCVVLIYDKEKDNYPLFASLGLKEPNQIFDKNTHIINYLLKTHHHLLKDKTIANLSDKGTVKEDLKKLNAELVIPIILHDDLMGALALGRKKSGEDYTQDDLDILLPLSQTLAVAISNAQLFVELSKTQAEAAQREKMAVIGTLASGINHEICNPLGIARGQCEAFLLNKRDGIYHDKSEAEQLNEALRIMELVIKETDRATSITKKLSTFAKPSKGEVADDVDISKELDEVVALVGYELKLDKIELIKNIPPTLPHIRADKKQLQEIFFNLIRNAAQAITESGKISVSARVDGDVSLGEVGDVSLKNADLEVEKRPQDSKVIIDISDTGCGIPDDKLKMIFNPFYTTKEPGKGTGLGLFIVRQVVERNKGKISLKSKVGAGTTFTLEFPVVG